MIFGNDMEKVTKKSEAFGTFPNSPDSVENVDNVDYFFYEIKNIQLICTFIKKSKCIICGGYPPKTIEKFILKKWICG